MRHSFHFITLLFLVAACSTTQSAIMLKEAPIQEFLASSISNNFENVSLAMALDEKTNPDSPSSETEGHQVSAWKAGLYSALLPGLGEYYVGHRSKARVFFAVETVTWISYLSYQIYGGWKKADMVDFAAVHANASLSGKSDEFNDFVGFYEDIDQYNSLGRVEDPQRPYLVDNAENHWRWQSANDQSAFRQLKNRSREAFRRRDFMLGLAIVNRIVSIVDAIRDAKRSGRTIKENDFSLLGNVKYRCEFDPLNQNRPLSMAVYTRF